jgi:sialic acid synthase SpsE
MNSQKTNIKSNIFLEAGINHFGDVMAAHRIIKFFIKSEYKNLTFMIHKETFYKKQFLTNKIDFKLQRSFYQKAIDICHKKNKRIGLSVCDLKSCNYIIDLNFDFYKILGISINNKQLIQEIDKKKKPTYVSLAIANNNKIKNLLKYFYNKKNLRLIYTSMSYEPKDLNLNKISSLNKKFNIPVGYGHHYKNLIPFSIMSFYKVKFIFFYIKGFFKKKNKYYPDNDHAIFIKDLKNVTDIIEESNIIIKNKKNNEKIKLNDKKIKK